MELNLLIAAPGQQLCQEMKARLSALISYTDVERASFLLCETLQAAENIPAGLWTSLHMAFIDLTCAEALRIGAYLYRQNPSCRLIYCGTGTEPLLPLFPSRPVWYWRQADDASLKVIFMTQLSMLKSDPGFFYYADRFRSVAVPYSAILCFYAQKRMVYLHTAQQDLGPIPRTLDQLEAGLPSDMFLRVHQSFLIARQHFRVLSRGKRILTLSDDFEVPISRSCFEQTVAVLCQNNVAAVQNDDMTDFEPDSMLSLQQEQGGAI